MTQPDSAAVAPQPRRDGVVLLRGDGGTVALVFDRPDSPVNVVGAALLQRLDDLLAEVEHGVRAGAVRAVLVRSEKPGVFLAGADLDEVRRLRGAAEGRATAARGQQVLRRLERLEVPTFAVLDGACLGAGLEVALACAHRLGSDAAHTRLGLPETRFGLLPALGGTVRLPRLVGLRAALELIVGGRTVDAAGARALGLLDEVYPAARLDDAVAAFVAHHLRRGRGRRGPRGGMARRLLEETAPGRRLVLRQVRRELQAAGGAPPAVLRALETVGDGVTLPLDAAFEREAEVFGELVCTAESRGYLQAAALRRVARSLPTTTALPPVEEVVVLGGGAPGGALAYRLASAGISVRVRDARRAAVAEALRLAGDAIRADVAAGALREGEGRRFVASVEGAVGFGGFGTADVLVETLAAPEEAKRAALREGEEHVGDRCVLVSTSLALPVARLAAGTGRPERVVGLHLFPSPAEPRMAEVIRTSESGDEAVAALHALARRLGIPALVVRDAPGALLFRLAVVYVDEAMRLVEEGTPAAAVDGAMTAWGMRPGPLALAERVGTAALARATAALAETFPERVRPPATVERKPRRAPRRGEAAPAPAPSTEPSTETPTPPEEVVRRLRAALLNEAARALEDGVVPSAAEVDFAAIHALGFPAARGGLLWDADRAGPAAEVAALRELAVRYGPRFEPAPLLVRLATEGGRFHPRGDAGEGC